MTPYLKNAKKIKKYKSVTDALNKAAGQTGGVWSLPGSVTSLPPHGDLRGAEPTFGPYARSDIHKEIDHTRIADLDDLVKAL